MTRTLDMLCKCRDAIIQYPERLPTYTSKGNLFDKTIDMIHRQICKKSEDKTRTLDFTAQDLIEFSEDIQALLKRWETNLNPKKNIKALLKTVKDGKLSMHDFCDRTTKIMALRRDSIEGLTRTLSVLEYHSVYLYFIEETQLDEFALKFTQRFS